MIKLICVRDRSGNPFLVGWKWQRKKDWSNSPTHLLGHRVGNKWVTPKWLIELVDRVDKVNGVNGVDVVNEVDDVMQLIWLMMLIWLMS